MYRRLSFKTHAQFFLVKIEIPAQYSLESQFRPKSLTSMTMENDNLDITTDKLRDLSLNIVAEINNNGSYKFQKQKSTNFLTENSDPQFESSLTIISKISEEKVSSACLAGHVKAVMMSTVVIQQSPGSRIADSGTAVYYRKNLSEPVREIGLISDLFGRVSEPMYSMELYEEFTSNFLKIDSPVYYLFDDPRTKFISVECNDDGRYKVIQS